MWTPNLGPIIRFIAPRSSSRSGRYPPLTPSMAALANRSHIQQIGPGGCSSSSALAKLSTLIPPSAERPTPPKQRRRSQPLSCPLARDPLR